MDRRGEENKRMRVPIAIGREIKRIRE